MNNTRPVTDIINKRFSCRTYQKKPLSSDDRDHIDHFLAEGIVVPFGTKTRFRLIAATDEDMGSLKKFGTYGVIRKASGFVVGAATETGKNLEDYGYALESIVLFATGLGLGTCWLGGTFSKSGFAQGITLKDDEILPAVISLGYSLPKPSLRDSILGGRSKERKPWHILFFDKGPDSPLTAETAGAYRIPLEMVRIAPSSANSQPWRIVKEAHGDIFHFYLQRSKGLEKTWKLFGKEDLQRIDMGIAMYHFEAAAWELGLKGMWKIANPDIKIQQNGCEYIATWEGRS